MEVHASPDVCVGPPSCPSQGRRQPDIALDSPGRFRTLGRWSTLSGEARATSLERWTALWLVAVVAACGDSSAVGGNSSGGGGSTSSEGAAGGSGAGTANGGSGGGVTCTPLAIDTFTAERATLFISNVMLGEDDEDLVGLYVVDGVTGTTPVSMAASVDDCSASVPCVFVAEDVGDVNVGALFMANTGTLDLAASAPSFITGSLSDVILVEITVDEEGSVTIVPAGGRCFDLASVAFELVSPADGWACSPLAYDETGQGAPPTDCECTCGAIQTAPPRQTRSATASKGRRAGRVGGRAHQRRGPVLRINTTEALGTAATAGAASSTPTATFRARRSTIAQPTTSAMSGLCAFLRRGTATPTTTATRAATADAASSTRTARTSRRLRVTYAPIRAPVRITA